jgi:adenosylcobinamide-GDP ribazoletransferase
MIVALDQLVAAFVLLTRFPVGRLGRGGAPVAVGRCVWAFPVAGLVVNLAGGLIYWLAHRLGMPPLLDAVWAVVVMTMATGGLHEDGLADTADGFGGGGSVARKLEIMRDSRIGTYGALALLLSVLIRTAALAALGDARLVVVQAGLAGMLGRGAILVLLLVLRPARSDGMGAGMGEICKRGVLTGLAMVVVACLLAEPFGLAVVLVLTALGASLAVARLASAQIGGYTGDALGAAAVIVECVALTAASGWFGG